MSTPPSTEIRDQIKQSFPYQVAVEPNHENLSWIKDNIGEDSVHAVINFKKKSIDLTIKDNAKWAYYSGTFYFRQSADAMLFKLMWHK